MNLLQNNFAAGELAPEAAGRSDLPEYYQGCREVTNMIPKPSGGVMRRPGLEFVAAAYSHSYASRLFTFVKGSDVYILEFSNSRMRVFKDGSLVLDGASPYTYNSPYTASQVQDMVFAANGAVVTHPDALPRIITCEGDTDWDIGVGQGSGIYGPYQDENADATFTLTPDGTTGYITVTSTEDLFEAAMDKSAVLRLIQEISENTVSGRFTGTETSSTFWINGKWELTISGLWVGLVKLQRSVDDGSTWKEVRSYQRDVPENAIIKDAGEESELDVLYRIDFTGTTPPNPFPNLIELLQWLIPMVSGIDLTYSLKVERGFQIGVVGVWTTLTSKTATCLVSQTLGGTGATYRWQLNAWNGLNGYPACCAMHDGRVYVAATTDQPVTIWSGRPFFSVNKQRIWDQGMSVEDDDAFTRTLSHKNVNEIRWLVSLWPMLIGADGALLKGIGANEDSPMTSTDANFIKQNAVGSSVVQPEEISGKLVYCGRDGTAVYEMNYSDDKKQYSPLELTRYREHIAVGKIKGWCFQQRPVQILWARTEDGGLIGVTRYQRTEEHDAILAWFQCEIGGDVESATIEPGEGAEDRLWLSIKRTVNGSTYRSIERMKPFDFGTEQRDAFFVDSGTTWDGGAAVTVTDISVDGATGKVTVTAAGHGFEDGYQGKISTVVGMTDVNGKVYTVADKATNTFVLKTRSGSAYIDGSAFGSYTSGGSVERVANSVTGLTQLAGEDVVALHDGQPATGSVNASGVYTIGSYDRHYFNTIHVGREYDFAVSPMRPEARTTSGALMGLKKKITEVNLRLYRAAGGSVGMSSDDPDLAAINYGKRGDASNPPVELFTGDIPLDNIGGWNRGGDLWVGGSGPLPFNLLAIAYGLEV